MEGIDELRGIHRIRLARRLAQIGIIAPWMLGPGDEADEDQEYEEPATPKLAAPKVRPRPRPITLKSGRPL